MFLSNLTNHILSKSEFNLADLCIVVPNNRAIVHLREQLKNELTNASFLPEMISIQDFVLRMVNFQKPTTVLNNVDLLLELFKVYKSTGQKDDFKKFISWAPTVLKDFNEIDLYMANADDIFTYLSEAQAIKLWSPQYNVLSDYEKDYLKFLESLKDLYHNFKTYLNDNGFAYTGQAYRNVAENIESLSESIVWDKIVFAGFNALSKSEIKIFNHLYKDNLAEIIWDLDKYYFDDKRQEAGMFLREMYKLWPKTFPEDIEENFSKDKEIHIIATAGNIQQAKVAGNILKENNFIPSETAVVLADEALLLPMLNSIPEKYDKFNVTMGVPLNGNAISMMVMDLFTLHSKSIISENNVTIFKRDNLKKIVLNPIFSMIFKDLVNPFSELLRQEYIPSPSIVKIILHTEYQNIERLFMSWRKSSMMALEAISNLLDYMIDEFSLRQKLDLESEISYNLKNIIDSIISQINKNDFIEDLDNLFLLLKYYLYDIPVSFRGEPLEGLQILGILETRLLDFKNLIITSMNEDVLPKIVPYTTFLTSEMVSEYQLPTSKAKTAVFAYHFYRLIQRAENIYLIYDSSEASLRTNEKSRYISQLEEELPKYISKLKEELPEYNPNINIHKDTYQSSISETNKLTHLPIKKTESTMTKIMDYLTNKEISASALNLYLACQVKFYFRYILKIDDEYDIKPVNAMFIGTMTHDVLKLLYSDYIGKEITLADLESIKNNIDTCIKQIETKYYEDKKISFEYGKNLLVKNMVKNYIENAIKTDEYFLKEQNNTMFLKSLEKDYPTNRNLTFNGKNINIKFKGTIDRFDICSGQFRIMDYKTGKVDEKLNFNIDKIKEAPTKNSMLIQLLIYAILIFDYDSDVLELTNGIYALKMKDQKSQGCKVFMINDKLDRDNLASFEDYIKEILVEMLDATLDFSVAADEKYCDNCSYRVLCMM